MQATADAQLLREYARQGSEAAFGELVARYTDLVYATALRQTGCPDSSKEIAQSVFTDLARKASSLSGSFQENATIVGWLYRSTRFAVSKHLRAEHRRRTRERLAMQDLDSTAATSTDWEQVRPKLDEALEGLTDEERQAMLLRFFQNQNFQAVGAALGISDDTAQKRVMRALEKLRQRLARHGITTTAAMLSTVLAANAHQIAPAGLATKLAGASLAAATIPTTTTFIIMAIASFKTGLVTTVIATGLAVWLAVEHRTLNQAQSENANLNKQLAAMRLRPSPTDQLPSRDNSNDAELNKLRREHAELLKLRGEVGVLRASVGHKQAELSQAQSEKTKMENYQKAEARGFASVNFLKQASLEAYIYANDHGGKFPTNFAQIKTDGFSSDPEIGTNSFEFYNYDAPLSNETPSHFFYAREKEPRKLADDRWSRVYLIKDGAVQTAESSDGNFDQWEKDWLQSHETNK